MCESFSLGSYASVATRFFIRARVDRAGAVNYWANDIFKRRILYGPERNQYYLAARSNTALAEDPFLALYLITPRQ